MSAVVNQEPEAEVLDDPEADQSRITPVMPIPKWLRDLDDEPTEPSYAPAT
jgi:hypothetical protein